MEQRADLLADLPLVALTAAEDLLGECPTWSEKEQSLYWIDVRGKAIRRLDMRSGTLSRWEMPDLIGCFALKKGGGAVVGLREMVASFDFDTRAFAPLSAPHPGQPDMRFNDGRCDRQGRLWAGTMNDVTRQPVGHLYRIDGRGSTSMLDLVAVPNSLCWSPDGRVMYFADGVDPVIWAFDFDTTAGALTNRRLFAHTGELGIPDGATVDSDGNVWSAQYGAAAINCYAPDGALLRSIPVPVSQPTCVCFGGPEYRTLFITTARQRLTTEALAKQPLAGAVLAFEPGAQGLPEPRFAS